MKNVIRNLPKSFFKFIHYEEKPPLNKLDRTKNKTREYFRETKSKGQKRKFRTLKWIINQIYYKWSDWIKNSIKSKEKRKLNRKKLILNEKMQIGEMGLKINFKKRF